MKSIFTLVTLGLGIAALSAQTCNVNPNANELGFNPNPIPPAIEGTNYNHQNTVVLPEWVESPPSLPGDSLPLCGVKITSVSIDTASSYNGNVPAGFNYTWKVFQGSTEINATNSASTPINITSGSGSVKVCLLLQANNVPAPIGNPCDTVAIKVLVQGRLDLLQNGNCADVSSSLADPAEFIINWPVCNTTVSITELASGAAFQLLPNVPNPADNNTFINVQLPQSGLVNLQVFDALGRMIHTQQTEGDTGLNQIELNTQTFSNGIYFYTLNFAGKSVSAKFIVQH
jgi:hypothetical protein